MVSIALIRRSSGRVFLLLLCLVQVSTKTSTAASPSEWRSHGRDNTSSRYSSLDQIHAGNVRDVSVAWRWQSPENAVLKQRPNLKTRMYQAEPLMIGGVLYVSTSLSQVAAIDAQTGKTIWVHDPKSYESGSPIFVGFVHRGVAFWSDHRSSRILLATADARLIALDAGSGQPITSFGRQGTVDLTQGLRRAIDKGIYAVTSPPIVVGDVVVVGSYVADPQPRIERPPGDVRGFDVRTGKQLWIFESVPQAGQYGNDTWENESWRLAGNTNVWTNMAADDRLGYVYLPFSTATNDYYGGHRPGANLFADTLVCLNVKTGKRVWHFQTVHHGLWDYDLPAAPNLVEIRKQGRTIKAVAQVTKQGYVYVFDRVDGTPVWPIREQPVAMSAVPGEHANATQPVPEKPVPFDRQGLSVDDLIDFTPELRQQAKKLISAYDYGPLFIPPSERGLISLPGILGGANLQGAAFEPRSRTLYVPSLTLPTLVQLASPAPGQSDVRYWGRIKFFEGPQKLPLSKPPYGRVTAIDMDTGEHLWVSPLGEGPKDHALIRHLNLPRLGWPHRGFPLVTRTLLFVGQEGAFWRYMQAAATGTKLSPKEEEEVFRLQPSLDVFDKRTGKLLHSIPIPANVTGQPITYTSRGNQFIVFATGGATGPAELVALSLSKGGKAGMGRQN